MITDERRLFLEDIATIAFEGGSNYWLKVNDLKYSDGTERSDMRAKVTVMEYDEKYVIGLEDIAGALDKISDFKNDLDLPNWIVQLIWAANENNTCAPERQPDIDGMIADIVMQVAVLGTVDFS